MDFQKHTSKELVELFYNKPFQGQYPEKAKIVFLSSDANYSPEISNHDFFKYILEYQKDGVAFWKKHGCHHPFLVDDYPFNKNKDGVPFHRNFSKIGLSSEYAEYISFLELLDIPTIGIKSKDKKMFYDLISEQHLKRIENMMVSGSDQLFFVSNGVLIDLKFLKKKYNLFEWLDFDKLNKEGDVPLNNGNFIIKIPHFSAYQIHAKIDDINSIITRWVGIEGSSKKKALS